VVAEAADGDAAITALSAHRMDVALMDVRMPGMDGISATKQITTMPDPQGGYVPAIVRSKVSQRPGVSQPLGRQQA
jgi:CheY-like chemotaxis protein